MSDLNDRVAIVTGAGGGLGASIASTLAANGASVLRVDLQGDDCVTADVGTSHGNRLMVDTALDRYGRLDILVLNAGCQHMAPIKDFPEDEWDRLMNVMVKGPFLAIKHAWPSLTERPGGRIIATASVSSHLAEPYKAAYVAAKHAVLGLIKVAAIEGGPHQMTANAVEPGLMMTPLIENQIQDHVRLRRITREQVIEGFVERKMIKRPVKTQEVADAVLFLASPASSGITGASIPVDLGFQSW